MNALRSIRLRSNLSNWTKFEDTLFLVRVFHKPRDTNPNKYPSNTPIIIGIVNEGEICMQTNSQILLNIYEAIQSCLLP